MEYSVKDAFRHEGEKYPLDVKLTLPSIEYNGSIGFKEPVHLQCEYWCVGEQIKVQGDITALLTLECDRCTIAFEMPLQIHFEEQFANEQSEEDDCYPISANDRIDFLPLVQDCIISAIPIERICREDCKGLCAYCGKDKNFIDCLCTPPDKDNPFSVLRKLVD